jgi:hypothetical protein
MIKAALSCNATFYSKHFKTVSALLSNESNPNVLVKTTTSIETVNVPQTAMKITRNRPIIVLGK